MSAPCADRDATRHRAWDRSCKDARPRCGGIGTAAERSRGSTAPTRPSPRPGTPVRRAAATRRCVACCCAHRTLEAPGAPDLPTGWRRVRRMCRAPRAAAHASPSRGADAATRVRRCGFRPRISDHRQVPSWGAWRIVRGGVSAPFSSAESSDSSASASWTSGLLKVGSGGRQSNPTNFYIKFVIAVGCSLDHKPTRGGFLG
jgi:hypothetical protein